MKVFKIVKPFTAYSFKATADGNNLTELENEVSGDGGVVERVNDEVVVVKIGGISQTLPIGFTVLIDEKSVARVISNEQFAESYVDANGEAATLPEVNEIAARAASLEEEVSELKKLADSVAVLDARISAMEAAVAESGKKKADKTS